ncbi:MAG: hypothetical protein JSV86_16500 [Gemmatimonadota bacterium]|nr:MAG: hypothetical protein JSV86_16500 [Gemmatimonadota bacterium]
MRYRTVGLALWFLPFIGLAGCLAEAPRRLAQVRDSAGIRIVENADYSLPDGQGWRLSDEPLLDIGALESDSSYQLYQVVGSQRLSDGRIAVANAGSSELRLYDAHGTHLFSTGREGGGPGEFGRMTTLASMTGDSLLVYDSRNQRVSVFDAGGALARTAQLHFLTEIGGVPMIVAPFDDGQFLVGVRTYSTSGERGSGLSRDMIVYVRCDSEGSLADTLAVLPGGELKLILEDNAAILGDRPFGRLPSHAVYADGFYYGSSDRYEIDYYSKTGKLQRSVRRAIPNLQVTDTDIESYRRERLENAEDESHRRMIERLLADDPFPQSFPAYGNLMVDAEGNLWVTVYRRPGDDQPRWTVFDPSGQMLGVVSVPERFTVHQIGSDFVLGRWRNGLDIEHVQLYELIKRD